MRNFQQKKKSRRIMESPPILILLAIIVFIFAWNMVGLWGRMRDTAKNRKIAETKITELRAEKEKLEGGIAKLETEEGVEESIREKFGLAKRGEQMIIVVEDKSELEANANKASGSFFARL